MVSTQRTRMKAKLLKMQARTREIRGTFLALLAGGFLGRIASKMKSYTATPQILDLRSEAVPALKAREERSGNSFQRSRPRPVTDIDGLVLHQMGFSRGNDPRKYLGVPSHYIITADGLISQLHDWETYLYTSSNLNRHTISVEVAGNFRGGNGKWRKPEKFGADMPTPAQIQALRDLTAYVQRELARQGIEMDALWAHRQGSMNRGIDPGPDIWSQVVPWSNQELGLVDRSDEERGGMTIPESWKGGALA